MYKHTHQKEEDTVTFYKEGERNIFKQVNHLNKPSFPGEFSNASEGNLGHSFKSPHLCVLKSLFHLVLSSEPKDLRI